MGVRKNSWTLVADFVGGDERTYETETHVEIGDGSLCITQIVVSGTAGPDSMARVVINQGQEVADLPAFLRQLADEMEK